MPRRSTRRQFAAATLMCVMCAVIFGALAATGLHLAPPVAVWAGTGAAVAAALIITAKLPARWAYGAGSVLVLAIVATGLVHPGMYVIGGVFALLWVVSLVLGGRIDRERAAYLRQRADQAGGAAATTAP